MQPHNLHRASVRDQFLLVMLNLGESPRLQGWSSPRKNDRNKIWSKKVPSQPFGVPAIYTKKIGEKRELHQVESFVANITQLKLPTDFSAVFELTIDHTSQGGSLDSQPLKRSRFHHPKKGHKELPCELRFHQPTCTSPNLYFLPSIGNFVSFSQTTLINRDSKLPSPPPEKKCTKQSELPCFFRFRRWGHKKHTPFHHQHSNPHLDVPGSY